MKKWFLFLTICLCSFLSATPIQDHKLDPEALSQLCSALDIPEGADLLSETQARWLRKAGQERWELTELSPEQRAIVLDWAEKHGFLDAWKPALQVYDQALILGATTSVMKKRLAYLKELWLQGTRFHKIVWLTGERPLDPRVDEWTDLCRNESEAAVFVWKEAKLPAKMRQVPVLFIQAPMINEASALKRPTTADTLRVWLTTTGQSTPHTALFVSCQPFCGYQFAVINTCLPASIHFDLVGDGIDAMSHPRAAAVILDTIARWLYQESRVASSL